MKVHLILVAKYRKKLFDDKKLTDDLKQFIFEAVQKYNSKIIQMGVDKDHIHILLSYSPQYAVSSIVSSIVGYLKQYSTFQIWLYHKDFMSKHYWKHKILWSDGYFACSIGQVSQTTIEQYIKS